MKNHCNNHTNKRMFGRLSRYLYTSSSELYWTSHNRPRFRATRANLLTYCIGCMTWGNTPLFQICYLIARVNAEAGYCFLNWSSTWLHHKDMTMSSSTSYLMIVSVRFVILHYVNPYRQSVVETDSVKTVWTKRTRGKVCRTYFRLELTYFVIQFLVFSCQVFR
jgi:hypothetical protein